MSVFRSTNPSDFTAVDGIVINETAPVGNIKSVATSIVLMCGQFERGLQAVTEIGSLGDLQSQFGKSDVYKGNVALRNKKFSRLRVVRVIAAAATTAAHNFADVSATPTLTFTAAQGAGNYGNSIQVTIAAGTTSGRKYTVHDSSANAVLPDEVYDNVTVATITPATFAASKLVTVAVLSTVAEPVSIVATNLTGGTDGTIADTDYQTALALCAVEQAGNILFFDEYNAIRNGYLVTHTTTTEDKIVIICGVQNQTPSAAATDAALYRDTDGRVVYSYPWVQTVVAGANTWVNPASFAAATISQTPVHVDPAIASNAKWLTGITNLQYVPTRADYSNLMKAGVSSFEYDSDIGYKIKSGVTTQIVDTAKLMIHRRRMADFLTSSAAAFLKKMQNDVNSKDNRTAVKGAFLGFIAGLEKDGILPKDSEVTSGKAKVVDTDALNTDASIAAGQFKILWRQRIYSSMRFMIIQAEIGESVVVTAA